MLPNMKLSEAKREKIEPGGYVVQVVRAVIDRTYNRLQLEVDVCEGPHAGYFKRLEENYKFWGLTANLYLDQDDAWKFANAIEAFRQSNDGFTWDDDGENDEQYLVGKKIGAVTRRRHYIGNNGKEKNKMQVYMLLPAADVRVGNFKIPDDIYDDEVQKLKQAAHQNGVVDMSGTDPGPIPGFEAVDVDDTPF